MADLVVETKSLTKKFASFVAVRDLNISIEEGSVYGFLGPNGSGKSTTIRMLCGLLAPTSGAAFVLGINLAREARRLRKNIGYMSQKFSLYPDMSVIENLNLYAGLYSLKGAEKKSRIDEMLAFANLEKRTEDLTATLSGGIRQKLALGCAILHMPKILFLDEPTGGVDPKARRAFWEVIYDLAGKGMTVMVTTHFMDEAEHCDKVAFIYRGNLIADDKPAALKRKLPGTIYEVRGRDTMALLGKIKGGGALPLLDANFFGAKLHLLMSADYRFGSDPLFEGYAVERIAPTMEDLFVYLVKQNAPKGG